MPNQEKTELQILQEKFKENCALPQAFVCVFTLDVPKEPVITPKGFIYDHGPVSKWILAHEKDPLGNGPLSLNDLKPLPLHLNLTLRLACDAHE